MGLSSAMSSLDGFELAVIVVIGVAGAAAALVGALLTRRMVQRNDATSPQ